jgi:hypothetical protein
MNLVSALDERKNVFLPCHSSGLVLDIIAPLSSFLVSQGWNIPIYFLSPSANYVLKLADISSEWYAALIQVLSVFDYYKGHRQLI